MQVYFSMLRPSWHQLLCHFARSCRRRQLTETSDALLDFVGTRTDVPHCSAITLQTLRILSISLCLGKNLSSHCFCPLGSADAPTSSRTLPAAAYPLNKNTRSHIERSDVFDRPESTASRTKALASELVDGARWRRSVTPSSHSDDSPGPQGRCR
ncbi:hypothetical protein OH77DRAFT_1023566 [Trametes cingulata]|nr:hypothetical protein OH77DRAFT_1023566 [Trametes cingulata]